MKTTLFSLLRLFLVLGWLGYPTHAADYFIDGNNGNDAASGLSWTAAWRTIGRALNQPPASNGDVVTAAAAIYHENLNFNGKALTLRSVDPIDPAVVAATIIEGNEGDAVTFAAGETYGSALRGFTIRHGAGAGRGIYCSASSPVIHRNVISGNHATVPGTGIACLDGAHPIIAGCLVQNNTGFEGAVYCENSSPAIIDNFITMNTAEYGPGIYCSGASPQISRNTIRNNLATTGGGETYGGGILCEQGSNPEISRCVIAGNTVTAEEGAFGGGIFCKASNPTISNCLIVHNTTHANDMAAGGGVYIWWSSNPVIINCTIANNAVDHDGGGICVWYQCNATITNTIVWDNAAATGTGIYVYGSEVAATYCDVSDGWTGEGNIADDPKFVEAGSNFHLRGRSPCIDAGTNVGAPERDFDDQPRPNAHNGIADIGADEFYAGNLSRLQR